MPIPVFMYHAVYGSIDCLKGADHHYAVSKLAFNRQIEQCKTNNLPVCSLKEAVLNQFDENSCVFTFDDGHESNFEAAVLLHGYGYSGDFFVNTATIGTANFLSSSQLSEMHTMGMSIQSHGHNHLFMTDLEGSALIDELKRSKFEIEDTIGAEVTIFAPPGGRVNDRVVETALNMGYNTIANSKPGYASNRTSKTAVPRIPVVDMMSIDKFSQYLRLDSTPIMKAKAKHVFTSAAKGVFGNVLYDRLWNVVRG